MFHSKLGLSVVAGALLICTGVANASSVTVFLDEDHQGKGNKGLEFRPVDETGALAGFLLTAMSSIDNSDPFGPGAMGLPGTVYIEKNAKGAGVQTAGAGGSKLISGGGGHKDEQLIFTFDVLALSSSIRLGLTEFKPGNGLNDKDDPVLFITFADSSTQVLTEVDYLSAFQSTGSKTGIIDFSLLSLNGTAIDEIGVRETNGHLGVNLMAYAVVPLPPAAILGLAGLGMVGFARRRKLI